MQQQGKELFPRQKEKQKRGFWKPLFYDKGVQGKRDKFIRLRRRPRALPVDECVCRGWIIHVPKYRCFGGFRHWRITLRSLGVGGYFMEVPRALPVGLHDPYSLVFAHLNTSFISFSFLGVQDFVNLLWIEFRGKWINRFFLFGGCKL